MQERKVLTLTECLKLGRPLTLQEAVDLPLNTYKNYLYARGILRYLPERIEEYITENRYDYIPENNTDYDPSQDIVILLNGFEFDDIIPNEEYLTEEVKERMRMEDEECDYEPETIYDVLYVNEQKLYTSMSGKLVTVYEYLPDAINIVECGIFYGEVYEQQYLNRITFWSW